MSIAENADMFAVFERLSLRHLWKRHTEKTLDWNDLPEDLKTATVATIISRKRRIIMAPSKQPLWPCTRSV